MLSENLLRLLAKYGPDYAAKKAADDEASEAARIGRVLGEQVAARRRVDVLQAVLNIFEWFGTASGKELLAAMSTSGLGRVPASNDIAIFSDGSVEFYHFAKQWSATWRFHSARDFAAKTTYANGYITRFDACAIRLAAMIGNGTLVDNVATELSRLEDEQRTA